MSLGAHYMIVVRGKIAKMSNNAKNLGGQKKISLMFRGQNFFFALIKVVMNEIYSQSSKKAI